jgi:hypothetical protein
MHQFHLNASISSSKAVLEPVSSSRSSKRKAFKSPLERGTPKILAEFSI